MDHIVYTDKKADELQKLLAGGKTMIVRGAAGRKLPYGRVQPQDRLFFIQNDGNGLVTACGIVNSVLNSEALNEVRSRALLNVHRTKLSLTAEQFQRWERKRYLVLIQVREVRLIGPFHIDRTAYGNMDDWLPVGEIESVRRKTG